MISELSLNLMREREDDDFTDSGREFQSLIADG